MKIPEYEERLRTPDPARLPEVRVMNLDAGVGEALSGAGAQITNAGSVVAEQQLRETQARDDASLAEFDTWSRETLRTIGDADPSEVETLSTDFLKKVGEQRSKILSGYRPPLLTERLKVRLEGMTAELRDKVEDARAIGRAGRVGQYIEQGLAERARQVETDPDAFQRLLGEQSDAVATSLVSGRAKAASHQRSLQVLGVAALTGAIRRDPRAALSALEDPKSSTLWVQALDAETRAKGINAARTAITEQAVGSRVSTIVGAFKENGRSGDALLRALDADESLAEGERVEVRRQVRAQLGVLQDERSRQYADQRLAIVSRIQSGNSTAADMRAVDQLYDRLALTEGQRESFRLAHEANLAKARERDAGAREVAALLSAGIPLDPTLNEHRKALAGAFEAAIGPIPVSDERSLQTALGFAKQTRMLPPQVSSWLNSAARSPDERLAVRAADYAAALRVNAPEAWGELTQDARSFLGLMGEMMTAGADPKSAFQTARANVYETPPATMAVRKDALPAVEKALPAKLSALISRDFAQPGWFAADPASTQRLRGDMARQTREYFLKTGNLELATDLAWTDLKRVYGVTRVNGEAELQPFPVESLGLAPEDARAAVGRFLSANPQEGLTAERVRIVADDLTLSAVGDALSGQAVRPSWALVSDTGDVLLNADGTRARLMMPSADVIRQRLEDQRKAADAATVAKARQEREQILRDRKAAAERNRVRFGLQ